MTEHVKPSRIIWDWTKPPGLRGYTMQASRDGKIIARFVPSAMSGLAYLLNDYEERLADAIAQVDRCHERE